MARWKWVVGYRGYYKVSDDGRVRSVDRMVRHSKGGLKKCVGLILKQRILRGPVPYRTVTIGMFGKRRDCLVHRLVLEAFVGPCPNGMEACHGPDRDAGNNKLENLRWATPYENHQDKIKDGTTSVGETNGNSKLTNAQVRQIRRLLLLETYKQYELAKMFHVGVAHISDINRGKTRIKDR